MHQNIGLTLLNEGPWISSTDIHYSHGSFSDWRHCHKLSGTVVGMSSANFLLDISEPVCGYIKKNSVMSRVSLIEDFITDAQNLCLVPLYSASLH